jgi:hypothetical protein
VIDCLSVIDQRPQLPGWVRALSKLIIFLQRLGIAFFSFHVLSIPGRRSGLMRTTVVSPFTVAGERYLLSFGQLDWVKNARAAGWGILRRGRREERVVLAEMKPPSSARIVGEFPKQIPAGVQFFIRMGFVDSPGRSDQFEAAVDKLALFRVDRAQAPSGASATT